MKTWLTYLAALFLALATTLVAGRNAEFATIVTDITFYLEDIGVCVLFLVVALNFVSGIASCRKDAKLGRAVGSSVVWALLTTILLSLVGALVFLQMPSRFPVSSTAGMDASYLSYYPYNTLAEIGYMQYADPLSMYGDIRVAIPVLLIVAFILGYHTKPDFEMIRPAYVVANSLSETSFRIMRSLYVGGLFFIFFAGCSFFSLLWEDASIFVAPDFLTMMIVGCVAAAMLVLPVMTAAFTKFRVNPYQVLYRSLAPMVTGLVTGSAALTVLSNEPNARKTLGIQKRYASTVFPFYAVVGRGGTAMIATLSCLSLIEAAAPGSVTAKVAFAVAGACAMMSFISLAGLGAEVFFIVWASAGFLGINFYGAELSIIGLLPLLGGMGAALDALLASCGSVWTCQREGTRVNTPYSEIL